MAGPPLCFVANGPQHYPPGDVGVVRTFFCTEQPRQNGTHHTAFLLRFLLRCVCVCVERRSPSYFCGTLYTPHGPRGRPQGITLSTHANTHNLSTHIKAGGARRTACFSTVRMPAHSQESRTRESERARHSATPDPGSATINSDVTMTNSTTGLTPVLSWLQKGPLLPSHATFAILFVSRPCGTLAVRKWTPPSTPASYGTA
eukprot:scaffold130417_cov105-Phaeocystis_antarctica.AAC.1